MKTLASVLLLLSSFAFLIEVRGQDCAPAELYYIVRDKKGRILSKAALQTVYKSVSRPDQGVSPVGFSHGVSTVGLDKNGMVVRHDSSEVKRILPVIFYTDMASCVMPVREFTLNYAGSTMRLIFNLNVDGRSYTIDSLAFQNGTFQLDQNGLSNSHYDGIIPASRWKKISGKP